LAPRIDVDHHRPKSLRHISSTIGGLSFGAWLSAVPSLTISGCWQRIVPLPSSECFWWSVFWCLVVGECFWWSVFWCLVVGSSVSNNQRMLATDRPVVIQLVGIMNNYSWFNILCTDTTILILLFAKHPISSF